MKKTKLECNNTIMALHCFHLKECHVHIPMLISILFSHTHHAHMHKANHNFGLL